MSEPKFCKYCQYFSRNQSCDELFLDYDACVHPKSPKHYDLVNGELLGSLSCMAHRSTDSVLHCGEEAKWFKLREIKND